MAKDRRNKREKTRIVNWVRKEEVGHEGDEREAGREAGSKEGSGCTWQQTRHPKRGGANATRQFSGGGNSYVNVRRMHIADYLALYPPNTHFSPHTPRHTPTPSSHLPPLSSPHPTHPPWSTSMPANTRKLHHVLHEIPLPAS
ncbi:hypothetical protein E2C01_040355 [Portunus trituberculatus]|uniref:Uncharacterized protein n=1 Tax=Portunus trituberculatus TaxID=210409 RepID=A0A5B7FHB8_PORTR|nr:hypothetical protein [Portunus trituberculatus]